MPNERIKSSRVDYPLNLQGANTVMAPTITPIEEVKPISRRDPVSGEVIVVSPNRDVDTTIDPLDCVIHGLAHSAYVQGDDLEPVAKLVEYYRHRDPEALTKAMGKLAAEIVAVQATNANR